MGFEINKSKVSADHLAEFLAAPIDADLLTVPGLGPFGVAKLNEVGIKNTFNLIGHFMLFIDPQKTNKETLDGMWYWLGEVGINAHRSGIVHAIVEKLSIMLGIQFINTTEGQTDTQQS